jgi:T5SS/PEP-CTERM-associated repeat protein
MHVPSYLSLRSRRACFAGILSAALAASGPAHAADRTWSNTAGGVFGDSGNWVGGLVPGTNDNANFTANASYPVTFGGSATNYSAYFYAPGGTVSLGVGAANLYDVILFKLQGGTSGAASVELNSGAVSAYKVYLGDAASNNGNRLTVSNPGTTLDTRGDDIYVGSWGSGNELLIASGATVAAGRDLFVGYNATSSSNSVTVSGANSRLISTRSIVVGRTNDFNRLSVEGGAEVACTNGNTVIGDQGGADWNSVFVGSGCILTNVANSTCYAGNAGANNTLTVSNATFYCYGNLNVGQSGSFNRLEVLAGAKALPRPHLYIGGTATAASNTVVVAGSNSLVKVSVFDINVGNSGHYNALRITDGATVETYRSIYVGTTGASSYNQISVSGTNSLLRSNGGGASYSIAVGKVGTGNSLVMDDGAWFISDASVPSFSIGNDVGTSSNSAFIGSGCVVTNLGTVYVGQAGNNNSMIVSNATFTAGGYTHVGNNGSGNSMTLCGGTKYHYAGHAHVGYNTGATSNTLTVTGSGTVMTNQNYDLDVGYNGGGNRMRIADGALVAISRSVYVGHNAGATNNILEIDGGTLRSLQAYPGGTHTMTVANSGTLGVYGANSLLAAKALQIVSGSTLDIRLGPGGFTPIACTSAVTYDATTKLNVVADAFAKAGGGTIRVMTYANSTSRILEANITVSPAGTVVTQTNTYMDLTVPGAGGTVVLVR